MRLKDRRPLSRRSDPDAGVHGVAASRAGVRYPAAAPSGVGRRGGDGVRSAGGGARRRVEGGRRRAAAAGSPSPLGGVVSGEAAAAEREVCGGERGGVTGGGMLVPAAAAPVRSGLPGRDGLGGRYPLC